MLNVSLTTKDEMVKAYTVFHQLLRQCRILLVNWLQSHLYLLLLSWPYLSWRRLWFVHGE